MVCFALIFLAGMVGLPVEVVDLDGRKVEGDLIAVAPDKVVLDAGDGEVEISRKQLLEIRHGDAEETGVFTDPASATIVVTLLGGSRIAAADYSVESGRATFHTAEGDSVVCSTKQIQSVRFKAAAPELEEQWQAILEGERTGDIIVIRKQATVTNEDGSESTVRVLNQVAGLVLSVDPSVIAFEFDDTRVDVTREKVEGLVYFQSRTRTFSDPIVKVFLRGGSSWACRELESDGARLNLIAVSGVRTTVAMTELVRLDYSVGNLVFLHDLQPEAMTYRPHISSAVTPDSVARWFRPRSEQRFLSLGGKSYEHGVSLHSRTEISYRLTGDLKRFQTLVGIDGRQRGQGGVRLKIESERRTLFDEEVKGDQDPFALDLDITGIRRLKILVDFGADGTDRGDQLNLCNARLIK